jgi:dTDP-4-dehydrorhamnose reductase
MRNILFYGGASLLSTIWARCWKERYNIFLGLNERQIEIDNTQSIQLCNDFNKIKEILNNKQISHVINCAGLTNVEDC